MPRLTDFPALIVAAPAELPAPQCTDIAVRDQAGGATLRDAIARGRAGAKTADASGTRPAAHQAHVAQHDSERPGASPSAGLTLSCWPLRVTGGAAGPAHAVASRGD